VSGRFYGVGVGPGDPELITLKGYRILKRVDLVCAPKSKEDKGSMALSVVRRILEKDINTLELLFPMTRNRAELKKFWEDAAERVAAELLKGKDVAFVTMGDPNLYSTYSYIAGELKKKCPQIKVETVPGVTAILACAAAANQPVAEGNEKLAVIPAVYSIDELKWILHNFESVVLMKVSRKLDEVIALLNELDLKDKAFFAGRCGLPGEFFEFNLDNLVGTKQDYFSLLVVRKRSGKPSNEPE